MDDDEQQDLLARRFLRLAMKFEDGACLAVEGQAAGVTSPTN